MQQSGLNAQQALASVMGALGALTGTNVTKTSGELEEERERQADASKWANVFSNLKLPG